MVEPTTNDNGVRRDVGMDDEPNGEAALLLVESLLHGLIARGVISVEDAVEFVDIAAEVAEEIAGDAGDPVAKTAKALTLLSAIRASLEHDLLS